MFSFFRKGRNERPVPYLIDDLVPFEDAYQGVLVYGATGSGKTSGPGLEIALNILKYGRDAHSGAYAPGEKLGVLVLAAKSDVAEQWRAYCGRPDVDRLDDLIIYGPGSGLCFDFVNFELNSPGGSITSTEALMSDLVDAVSQSMEGGDNPFFPLTAKREIRHAIAAVWLSKGRCSVRDIYKFVCSLPSSVEELESDDWKRGFCYECLQDSYNKGCEGDIDFDLLADFVFREWPRLSDRTSSCVHAYAMATLDPFMSGAVAPLVSGGGTPFPLPDLLENEGKVIVVDCPVLQMREPGRLLSIVAKVSTQRSVLRRKLDGDLRGVCIFADEANWFAVEGIDGLAQSVARQYKLLHVMMAQNIPLLQKSLGGDSARVDLDGWMANFQTKIFTQNSCPITNAYASDLFGQSMQLSFGGSRSGGEYDLGKDLLGLPPEEFNASWNECLRPELQPVEFTRLQKGGKPPYVVEGIVYQGGREFPQNNFRTWVKAKFSQRI